MKELIKQFLRFTATGVTCFALDFGLMVFLKEVAGFHYLIASGISFCAVAVINYSLSVKWVYYTKDKSLNPIAFSVFLVLSAIGLLLTQLLMWFFVDGLGLYYMLSKVVSGIIVSFYNFFTRKKYLER
ncbi:GtrA family protein [Anaerovorax odorimutans]|uniref:GtrA family protein n=1 Tax=Anaerovorax odorimutans TaxID=109327 RepID=A0ABT1RR49_9FIRM|nr:GtrA family protein [Anaerovorax odorimutans]MCQ4637636.1 GtrA family protein [Anaerovorax odorimutans]